MSSRPPRVPPEQIPFFDAFLSYSSKDRKLVDELADRLTEAGLDVFFDAWFIEPGHHVRKVLLEALRKSRTVVACMTPQYFRSEWADFELNWNFVETQLGQGTERRVIPVLLRACEIPKGTSDLKRIDLTGEHRDAGYRDLVTALSHVDAVDIDSYVVPAGSSSRFLGDFVAGKLKRLLDFPEPRVHDFLTVYGELVQNAFDHVKKKNRVEASIRARASEVVLDISDAGAGFDLAGRIRAANDALASDPSLVGLRGLHLVSKIADRVSSEVRNRRHVVTAVLRRDRTTKETSDLADVVSAPVDPSRSSWMPETRGPWFVRFVDPSGRYACLAIKIPRVDHHNAQDLRQFFHESVGGIGSVARVIVDCSMVEYLSSAGLTALMVLAKAVRSSGGTCALVVCHPAMEEILEISRFNLVFAVYHSLDEALRTA